MAMASMDNGRDGSFQSAPVFMLEDLEEAFQYEVLKMLKKELGQTHSENL